MRSHAKATSAIAAIGCAIFLACLLASPALAAKGVVRFVGGTGVEGGQFATNLSGPGGVAVNQSGAGGVNPGEVYVVDRGNRRVQEFHADGSFVRTWGAGVASGAEAFEVCTVAASCRAGLAPVEFPVAVTAAGAFSSPQGIAIEQSTGNVYVTDQNTRRINVFSATGAFEGAFGWKVNKSTPEAKLQFCTTATGCLAGEAKANAGAFGSGIGFPALAPAGSPSAGHLFIPSKTNRRVDEFELIFTGTEVTGATYVKGFGWEVKASAPAGEFQVCTAVTECKIGPAGGNVGQFANGSPTSVGIDSNGRMYAIDAGSEATTNNRVQAFSSTPTPEGPFATAALSGAPVPTDLLVDPATDHVLALKRIAGEQRVLELDSAGTVLQNFEQGAGIPAANGIGAVRGGGDIYLTTASGPEAKPGLWILSSTLVPPAVTIEPVTTFSGTTATFEGHVTTDTIGARYHFEYSADGANWTALPQATLPGDGAQHAVVPEEVEGLEAHTEYQVRLVADKLYAGGSASALTSFTTGSAAPIIDSVSHAQVRDTSALLRGTFNPENEDTEYSFEYTDKAGYEAEGFNGAVSVPAPPGHRDGVATVEVSEQLSGLTEKTTYVYRLLVSNPTGDDESSVGTFTTYATPQSFGACANDQFRINRPSEALPDCRAYEQVSPVAKNGGNIQSDYFINKASPSGDRISFEAIAGIPGGDGSQTFPTYLATRQGGEWSTQGILPAASAGESAQVLGSTPDFAQVFSIARKFGTGTALFSRSSAGGSLSTISPYSEALQKHSGEIAYVGSSADGSESFFHVVDQLPVAPGSPAPAAGLESIVGGDRVNLYAWNSDTGELYFAGALPDGSAPKGAQAGYAGSSSYTVDTHAITEDGSVYFTDQGTGQLYRRLNPTAPETTNRDSHGNCIPDPVLACTVHVSASEKDDGNGLEGHDAAGAAPTKFMAASTDGAKAIFSSSEKLTDRAYTGPEPTDPKAIARADVADPTNPEISWLPASAHEIAVDETAGFVYWTDPSQGQIGRAKLDKSVIEPSYITGLDEPLGVAVIDEPSAEYIYWTERGELNSEGTAQPGLGSIGRADIAGTNVNPGCYTGLTNPRSVAVRPDFVYWTAPRLGLSSSGDLRKAALSCNQASIELVPLNQTDVEGTHEIPLARGDVAVNGSYIYLSWENGSASLIYLFNLDGSIVETIAEVPGATSPPGIAIDGSHVYWTDAPHGTIGRAELDGTNVEGSFVPAAGQAIDPALAGTHLLWSTNQEVEPNSGNDIYSYDSEAPEGERLTDLAPSHDGKDGIEAQGVLGASADASYVYFVANGVPDGPIANSPNARNEEAEVGDCKGNPVSSPSGTCNLYLAHEGEVTFIARLDAATHNHDESSSDAADWIASVGEIGLANSDVSEKTARVSTDGQTLLFRSQRQLTGYDNEAFGCVKDSGNNPALGHCPELYRYRVGEPGLTCVSCNPTGAAPEGFAELVSIRVGVFGVGAKDPAPRLSRNLSASGDRVFFETRDALVAGDTNGDESCKPDSSYWLSVPSCQDVYEWEAAGAGSCPASAGQQGCVYLLSTGKSPHPSFFGDASVSGDGAFLFTYSKLVRQDEDDQLDVYDASAEGGLASQDALPSVICEGEACKGPGNAASQSPSAGTQSFSGPADSKPAHKKTKKRKRRHRKHAKQHHRAKTNGRASR